MRRPAIVAVTRRNGVTTSREQRRRRCQAVDRDDDRIDDEMRAAVLSGKNGEGNRIIAPKAVDETKWPEVSSDARAGKSDAARVGVDVVD